MLKAFTTVFLFLFVCSIVFPFWNVFIKSFMTDKDIMFHPLALWPESFQLDGYKPCSPTSFMISVGRLSILCI